MKKLLIVVIFSFSIMTGGFAQNYNQLTGQDGSRVITTAVPFLLLSPDARAGSLGEAGVASEPDANSMYWNPAKYTFIKKRFGFAISYRPILRQLIDDINLFYFSGYVHIGDKSAIATTFRYFSQGDITFTDEFGADLGTYEPKEFAFDATYSRKFSDVISGAVAARFIYSNLTQGQFVQGAKTTAGTSIAADVALYYHKAVDVGNLGSEISWGINLSNIGNKISYSKTAIKKDFIPTNLKIGAGLKMNFNDKNSLAALFDFNKLMVPTPPVYMRDSMGFLVYDAENNPVISKGMNPNVSAVQGIIQSWYDAPYGFQEELKEWSFAFGLEYWLMNHLAIRNGIFYEDKSKGNRKFFAFGLGLRFGAFGFDAGFSFPLNNTSQKFKPENLRLSLLIDIK